MATMRFSQVIILFARMTGLVPGVRGLGGMLGMCELLGVFCCVIGLELLTDLLQAMGETDFAFLGDSHV